MASAASVLGTMAALTCASIRTGSSLRPRGRKVHSSACVYVYSSKISVSPGSVQQATTAVMAWMAPFVMHMLTAGNDDGSGSGAACGGAAMLAAALVLHGLDSGPGSSGTTGLTWLHATTNGSKALAAVAAASLSWDVVKAAVLLTATADAAASARSFPVKHVTPWQCDMSVPSHASSGA